MIMSRLGRNFTASYMPYHEISLDVGGVKSNILAQVRLQTHLSL